MPLTGEYEPSAAKRSRDQVALYERSGGTRGTTMAGLPVVIVTMIGARTGMVRKTPVMRVESGGCYAVVASVGGAPYNPAWYHNLCANPHVELQDGAAKRDYLARELTGDERATWWQRAVEAFPSYATYQRKTPREIPVLLLEPVPDPLA